MDKITETKFNANIVAINKDMSEISEGKLQSDELIKMQFKAIRKLVNDCEKLALSEK